MKKLAVEFNPSFVYGIYLFVSIEDASTFNKSTCSMLQLYTFLRHFTILWIAVDHFETEFQFSSSICLHKLMKYPKFTSEYNKLGVQT